MMEELPNFLATMRGLGMRFAAAFQNESQMRAKWDTLAPSMLDNAQSKFYFCHGMTDEVTLKRLSELLGEEEREKLTLPFGNKSLGGSLSQEWRPRMTPTELKSMPKYHALYFRGADAGILKLARLPQLDKKPRPSTINDVGHNEPTRYLWLAIVRAELDVIAREQSRQHMMALLR